MRYDYLIVGAGFSGAVLAERIANVLKKTVLVIDKREHIAGNAYDFTDRSGILVHKYGPHIFHTNSKEVFDYLSCFTDWVKYEHKVKVCYRGVKYPFPVNINTLNMLYGLNIETEKEVKEYFEGVKRIIEHPSNSEEIVLSRFGKELYKIFFEKFTEKSWFAHPKKLSASVCGRIKPRYSTDDRYFTDRFQYMPAKGYTKMFAEMLRSPRIKVLLNTDFKNLPARIKFGKTVFTGPIDLYFDYKYGKLPYRSQIQEIKTVKKEFFQENAVVNYAGNEKYTRITEFKHFYPVISTLTIIGMEYPKRKGEEFYPVLNPLSSLVFNKYKRLANEQRDVLFTGRLANYKYYNMDQVVAKSLKEFSGIS